MIRQDTPGETRAWVQPTLSRQQTLLLRIGGACAIASALLFALSLGGHGDLPTHVSHVAALEFIAVRGNWLLMHLGTIVAGLLWVFAVAALAGTLSSDAAQAISRLLLPSAIIGGLLLIFDYALDGYAFKVLADEWATSSSTHRANLEQTFDTLLAIGAGTFHAELLLFYGVSVLLTGLAIALDGAYPGWFGAIGAVAGGAAVIAGLAGFLGLQFRIDVLVFVVALPIEGLWFLALGILMWRRARQSLNPAGARHK